jgi:amidase
VADPLALEAPELARALAAGELGAEAVARAVLARIAAIDDTGPALGAIIEINPDAIDIARDLDRRFRADGPVGPLHGVPVVLKANIDTADRLATTAGSLALADHHAAFDAPLVARLRASGAVLIAKANLSEWANFRSLDSTSGWSSLGGQTKNPYALDRNPCGSSSGSAVAVAAGMVPLAVGTETNGSIVCPAAINGVVGIKPTVGLVSQGGIIPISATQDTAGPMARTVRGAAMLLAAMQTAASAPLAYEVTRQDLAGLRVGVLRDYGGAGRFPAVERQYDRWLAWLGDAGATLVDPLALDLPPGLGAAELDLLLYEFRQGVDAYLSGVSGGPGSLRELIAFNEANAEAVMPHFGQDLLEMAQAKGGLEAPAYRAARAASHEAVRGHLETLFAGRGLDVIVGPANAPAWRTDWVNGDRFGLGSTAFAAIAGYPVITVPGGLVDGLPVGLAVVGAPNSEALLIDVAAVFEARRGSMPAPAFRPSSGP